MDRNNTRFTTYHFKICQRRDKLIFVMTFVWSNEATSSYSCNLDQPSASRNLFQTEQARRRHENHCCSADFKCQCTFVGINPDLTSLISSVGKRDEERQPHFSLKYLVSYNHFFPPCTAHWVMWISFKKNISYVLVHSWVEEKKPSVLFWLFHPSEDPVLSTSWGKFSPIIILVMACWFNLPGGFFQIAFSIFGMW